MLDSTAPRALPATPAKAPPRTPSKTLSKTLSKKLPKAFTKLCLSTLATLAVAAGTLLAVALPAPAPVEAQVPVDSTFTINGVGSNQAVYITDTDANFSFTPGYCADEVSPTPPATNQDSPVVSAADFVGSTGNQIWNSGGASNFKMNTGCDYDVAMSVGACSMISVSLANGVGQNDVLQYAANDPKTGDVKFSGQSIDEFTIHTTDFNDLYFDTDSTDYDPDEGEFGEGLVEVTQFRYEITADTSCSSKPTLELHTNSDSAPKGDNTTDDTTPTFTVGNVVAGASVTLTYEKTGTAAVTTSAVMVAANETTVDITLPELGAGTWTVKASHTDGTKTANESAELMLTIESPSSKPTLALKTGQNGSKTGSSLTATNDTTPTFTVSNVAFGSTVVLEASKSGSTTVTETGMAAADPDTTDAVTITSVDVTLPALAPNAGDWTVKATHTDGSNDPTDSDDFTLTVDTVIGNITVTPNPANGTATASKTYTATDGAAETTTWVRQVLEDKTDTTCDTSVPTAVTSSPTAYQAQSYTESANVTISKPAYSDADNGRTLCFWATDEAGNSASQNIVLADLDTTGPVVTIGVNPSPVKINTTPTVTFTVDETTTDFIRDDIMVATADGATATLGALTGSGTSYMATLMAGDNTGKVTITVKTGMLTDALGHTNAASTGINGSNGQLEITIQELDPSAAPGGLEFTGENTGSTADTITYDNTPSFKVTGSALVSGADVSVTAAKDGSTDTVVQTETAGANVATEGVPVTFSGTGCEVNGTVSNADNSCRLGDGTWTFTATQTEDGMGPSAAYPTMDPPELTIDTTDPTVSIAFDPTETAKPRAKQRELTITAADTVTATGDLSIDFVKQGAACPQAPTALTGAGSYSGAQTYSSDGDSDAYICVEVTDEAGNKVRASDQIPTIDNVPPPVTARLVSATATREQKFQASTTETGKGTLTWKSASSFIASSVDCAPSPPGDANDYTPGTDAAKTSISEAEDGMKMCFWATDEAGNVGSNFVLVDHVDRTGPTVAVRLATSPLRINNTVTVLFSTGEPVLDFDDANDVTVTNSTTSPPTNASLTTVEVYDPDNDPTTDPHTWSATLTAGTVTGEVVIAVAAGALTDTPGNLNGDSSGNDGTNGRLVVNIMDLVQSDPPTGLDFDEDNTTDSGSDNGDGTTDDNTPGFEVDAVLAVGTIIRVTASKTGSSDTVTKSKTANADDAANGYLTLNFSGSGAVAGCATYDGTDTLTGQSCVLPDGIWTFTATREASNERESAAYPASNPPTLTIDDTDPMITASLVSSTPTKEQKFRAMANPAEPSTTVWKSASSFIASSATCANSPPSNADDYTPGTEATKTATLTSENGMKMCFWATDLAGNKVKTFVEVANVDSDAPVVDINNPTTEAAMSKLISAEDLFDDNTNSPTTWKYKVFEPTEPPTTSCPPTPPAGASDYTEGAVLTLANQSYNDGFVCFWSTDQAGNVGFGKSADLDGIDTMPPTVKVVAPSSVVKDGTATIRIEVTDKSAPFDTTDFDAVGDIEVTGSGGSITTAPALNSGEQSGDIHVFEATFTAGSMFGSAQDVTLQVAANKLIDDAGHGNTASNTVTISIVETQPSRTPVVALADASDTGAKDGRYTSQANPTFTVTFPGSPTYTATNSSVTVTATNEATNPNTVVTKTMTGVTGSSVDVEFSGTIMGCDTSDDADTTENNPCTLAAGNTWKIQAAHTDTGASHSEALSAEIEVTVLAAAEAVTLTASSSTLEVSSSTAGDVVGETATLTFTVPASYAGPSDSALAVASIVTMTGSGGSLGPWSRSGNTYTATFSSSGIGTASFTVAASALQDLAGNNNPALASPATIAVQVGPRPLELRNLAAAGNSSDRNYDLKVTPKTSSSACANAGARDTEYTIAAGASVTVAVGQDSGETTDCDWMFEFAAAGSDCAVSSWQFKESGHADDNASQGHGDTTKASPTEILEVSVSGGILWGTATIAKAVFDVVCPTKFDAMLEVNVTDPFSTDLTGIDIRVTLEKAASQPAGCEVPGADPPDVALGAAPYTAEVAGLTDKLVDTSSRMLAADADRCTYTAKFANEVNQNSATPPYRLVRTSAREVTLSNADANSRKPTGEYRVLRTAVLSLTNPTTAGHASAPTRRDVSVSVERGAGCSTTVPLPSGGPFAVASGASDATAVEIDFGTADCAWDLTFTNTADDCRVFAQPTEMFTGNMLTQANNSTGALTVHVINRRVRTASAADGGGSEIGSLKFTVPDPDDSMASPAGVCNTDLAGAMVEVEVDDRDSGTHTGTEFPVKVANGVRSDEGDSDEGTAPCSQNITDITLSLGAPTGAKSMVLQTVTGLIGTLHDGATCSYEITFPDPVTSVGSDSAAADDDDVLLELRESAQEPATATLSAATKVSRTYDALRSAQLVLHNATVHSSAVHVLANMSKVGVDWSLETSSCSTTSGGAVTLAASTSSASPVSLGTEDCQWNLNFANGSHLDFLRNCEVTAQLQGVGPDYTDLPGAANTFTTSSTATPAHSGTLPVWVVSNKVMSQATGGAVVGRIAFETGTCTTYFNGTVALKVNDTMEATHTGGMIEVELEPPTGRSDCSPVAEDVMVNIGTRATTRSGGVPFTGRVNNLIDDPLGSAGPCTYTATFESPATVGTGQAAVMFKRLEPSSGTATLSADNPATTNITESTVTAEYDAVRPALLALHNGTGPSDPAHVLDNMEQVGLSWVLNDSSSGCLSGLGSLTLAAGASAPSPVSLGTDDCQWDFNFANGPATGLLRNCRVEAQLQGLGPAYTNLPGVENTKTTTSTATPSTNNLGSFSVWVRGHRVMSQASGGAEVGRVEFEVSDNCTTFFNGTVALTVSDTMEATHTGGMVAVALAPPSGRSDCSPVTEDVMVDIGIRATTRDGGTPFTGVAQNLIGTPLMTGSTACTYTVAFDDPERVGSLSLDLLETPASTTLSEGTSSDRSSETVSARYDVIRDIKFKLDNITTATHTVKANRPNVIVTVTPQGSCATTAATGVPTGEFTPAAAAAEVTLGQADCDWKIDYQNTDEDCKVNVTAKDPAGGALSFTDSHDGTNANKGEFTLYVTNRRVRTEDNGGGSEVGTIEFDVPAAPADTCTTYFNRAVSVSTTNAQDVTGTHAGTMIDVTVSQRDNPQSPRAACSAAAAGLTETITLDAAGSGQETFMQLVNVPLGQTDRCLYEAAFETGVASNNNLRLNRTSTSPVDFDASTPAAATAVAATYQAVDSAAITLRNVTSKTSSHPLATMRDVVVTVTPTPSTDCTASTPSDSPFTLAAVAGQDSKNVSLGTQSCVWTLTFSNRNSDCLATAQFRNASGGTEGSLVSATALAGGSVTINVDTNRTTRIGATIGSGAVVASLDLNVPTADCDTYLDAEVSLSVTDTVNPTNPGVHIGTVFPVEVTRQSGPSDRCSADQTGNDALMLTLKADGTARVDIRLVDLPYGVSANSRCRYDVKFPASRNSAVSGATVSLETTDTAGVLRAGAASVSATYDAVRPATLDLENVTTASLTPDTRETVQVTLTPSSCSGAGTAPTTITHTLGEAGSSGATMEANLGTQNCTWTAVFQNPQRDCAISARLTDSSDADINSSAVTANNGAGSLVFYTQGRRARLTNTANGTVLSKAKFAVSATCATTFPGTVAVQVSDRNAQASHTGTAFSVTVAPAGGASGCSPSQNLTVTLTQPLSGSAPVNNLVGTPLGGQACAYTVTYTDATKVSAVDSTIQLERPSAFTATIRDGNAQARTASLTYVAVRPAAVELRNTTASRAVRLTPASVSTCVASKTALFELTSAASSETVRLGTRSCFWTIGFANSGDDCKVEARLKNTTGGNINSAPITSKPNAGSITLHVSSDRRVMSAASGGTEVGSVEFAVTSDCDTTFDATVSISVTDTLDVSISDRNHADTGFDVTVSSSGAGCSASATRRVMLDARNAASANFARLLNTPAASSACVYTVGFPSSVNSLTNSRVRLVSSTTGAVTVSGASNATRTAALAYTAELIPEPVVIQAVSVLGAPAVTEGQPLLFPIGLPGPAFQAVEVTYTISGLGGPSGAASGPSGAASGPSGAASGTATINAGQRSGVISVPTEDDQLDSADLTVQVTLTAATGGVPIDQFGGSATGIVRDNDPAPTVGIKAASAIGDQLRFTLELSARSARDVRVSYTTSLSGRGTLVIDAGQTEASAERLFDPVQLSRGEGLLLRLTSAQNATIDTSARERLLSSAGGVAWRFHVTGRTGVTPTQIAAAFGLAAGWKLYSWDTQFQRWTPHTATAGGRAALPRGATITFRGAEPEEEQLSAAGLTPTSSVTLRRGWNIFTPAPDAVGLDASDFTRTSAGNSAVIFDPRLINCTSLAGVLVIYTYDQTDTGAANGFRIALPCHPQVQADSGIPAIETIDENDTIYAWFNSTTPVTLTFRAGRYSPA